MCRYFNNTDNIECRDPNKKEIHIKHVSYVIYISKSIIHKKNPDIARFKAITEFSFVVGVTLMYRKLSKNKVNL